MNKIITLCALVITGLSFGQNDIRITEETVGFSIGDRNSIVVTIPNGKMDMVEKQLKSELKSWGGKQNASKSEYTTTKSSVKKMFGGNTFDAYVKIINPGDVIKVAVAVDLGGAFMNSNQHTSEYNEMKARLTKFATEAGNSSISNTLKAEQKVLSNLEKEQKKYEKEKESLTKSIQDYKKKISDAEAKIEKNLKDQSAKKEVITNQEKKIKDIQNREIK